MVITALARLVGKRVHVVPFKDSYIITRTEAYGLARDEIARVLPHYLVSGQITEFEPDIEVRISSLELDILFGRGTADVYGDLKNKWKEQRLTLDLHLLDADLQNVIEGVFVSNSVRVLELEKTQEFGFAIAGTGPTLSGTFAATQGLHRAIRYLVDHSVLQIISLLERIPYWVALGIERDEAVMAQLRNHIRDKLEKDGRRSTIQFIQEMLNESFPVERVRDPETGWTYYDTLPRSGILDPQTQAYLKHFVDTYDPSVKWNDLPQVYAVMVEYSTFDEQITRAYRQGQSVSAIRPGATSSLPPDLATPADDFDYVLSIAREQLSDMHFQSAIQMADSILRRDPSNTAAQDIASRARRALRRVYDSVEIR